MTPRSEKILNTIGFFLVVACFVFAMVRVFRQSRLESDGRTVVRFTHWQIEPGVREAFAALEREYEKMNPDVNIIQVPIPGRVFVAWRKTQLIGESPPDLLQLGAKGLDVTDIARFYTPLGEYVAEPNPYNKGTILEGLRPPFFTEDLEHELAIVEDSKGMGTGGYAIDVEQFRVVVWRLLQPAKKGLSPRHALE